jgi:predicted NBD/HSP70 family sugar kinase
VQQDLERLLQREVRLANDANCFALSEAVDGAAADAHSVFGVIIGTGAGGGIVINKQLHNGANRIAGEWGHNALPWPDADELPGPPCYCGKHGCIETFLSGPGFSLAYRQSHPQQASPDAASIVQRARDGEAAAVQALARYQLRLAKSLASIINVLDPDVIVLGGGMSNISELYEQVPRLWNDFVFADRVNTRLLPPLHGDSSGVRGAAWLWPQTDGLDAYP